MLPVTLKAANMVANSGSIWYSYSVLISSLTKAFQTRGKERKVTMRGRKAKEKEG